MILSYKQFLDNLKLHSVEDLTEANMICEISYCNDFKSILKKFFNVLELKFDYVFKSEKIDNNFWPYMVSVNREFCKRFLKTKFNKDISDNSGIINLSLHLMTKQIQIEI